MNNSNQINLQHGRRGGKGLAVSSMVSGIVSIAFVCVPVISGILAVLSLIFGIISLSTKKPGNGMAITGIVLSVVAVIVIVFILSIGNVKSPSTETSVSSTKLTEVEEKFLEDEYKDDCEKAEYNDILRNPDNYKGKKLIVTGEIQQIIGEDSLLFKSGYRFYEDNLSEKAWFINYELPEGASRILEGDNLTFYGEFNGIEKFSRTIGGDVYVPELKVKYVEIK